MQPSGGGRHADAMHNIGSHADLTSRSDFEARSLTRLGNEEGRQASKLVGWRPFGGRRDDVDRHMVGAGLVVPLHLAGDLVFVAPGHQRIEGAVTAWRRQLVLWPPEAHQVLAIVLQ